MIRRAESMRDILRHRQNECESHGRIPQITHEDFAKAGFYRALQPRRFGGYEFSMSDFVNLIIEISRGCSDSGWVASIIGIQPAAFSSLFPEQAQREIYGDTGHCCIASVIAPQGTATPTDGGYLIKGAWDYASGCDIATHYLMAVLLIDPTTQTPTAPALALFDATSCQIIDNWNVTGMRGTGSGQVVTDNLFIPDYRIILLTPTTLHEPGNHPGHALYTNALYHGIPLNALEFHLQATAVGAAKGALDAYEQILRSKKWVLAPFTPRLEMPDLQLRFGESQAKIDAAEAALLSFANQYTESSRLAYEGKKEFTQMESRRLARAGAECVELAYQAVDTMYRTGGSSSIAQSSLLGRYFRNLAALRTHIGTQRDQLAINTARLRFGFPPLSPI
jgi:3-hydroxy-9,10-secoandrosta-1,3,5(10)-triene-9,17-dione monooxygenase